MTTLSRKILFVDDDDSINILLKGMSAIIGYDVEFTNSAKEALKILDNEDISIIITDLKMPEMDGVELCKRIREKGSEAVIYGYSGDIIGVDSDHLEDVGFDALLWKPVRIEVLKRAIESGFEKINMRREAHE